MADVRPFRALRYDPETRPRRHRLPSLRHDLPRSCSANCTTARPTTPCASSWPRENGGPLRERRRDADASGPRRRSSAATPARRTTSTEQTFPYGDRSYTRRAALRPAARRALGARAPSSRTSRRSRSTRRTASSSSHAAQINASPVFLFYRDSDRAIQRISTTCVTRQLPLADFERADGQHHRLMRIDEPDAIDELERAFADRDAVHRRRPPPLRDRAHVPRRSRAAARRLDRRRAGELRAGRRWSPRTTRGCSSCRRTA